MEVAYRCCDGHLKLLYVSDCDHACSRVWPPLLLTHTQYVDQGGRRAGQGDVLLRLSALPTAASSWGVLDDKVGVLDDKVGVWV
jgi:hypothetical protein